MAKKHAGKMAIIDKTTGKSINYSTALIGALILKSKFERYDKGFIGIMIPTSAGCALAVVGALMSGRIPVMINYSTGAADNAKYAQKKCKFKTIITSKALLDKIKCPVIDGMVMIEDIMKSVTTVEKLKAALKTKLPVQMILNCIHKGENTAAILFTSGSEKDPKAVQLTHLNISSNIKNFGDYVGLSESDIILANLVFFHIFGLTVNLWVSFYYGMTMVAYFNPSISDVQYIAREERPTLMDALQKFLLGLSAEIECPGISVLSD
jgi:acyl-[acyl-carrier-protein]-phospholipid O-acyltransferase/long-chain-fatty-acid--[acyl-carrier-protein] ligase